MLPWQSRQAHQKLAVVKRARLGVLNHDEKREMLNLVLSNPQIENGSLRFDFRKPFSMFVGITDLEIWRSQRDEFRTYLRSEGLSYSVHPTPRNLGIVELT